MVSVEFETGLQSPVATVPRSEHKLSVTTQISETVNVLDEVISHLRSAQNGNPQDNEIAEQLISSLAEIRGRTIKRTPAILWHNPQILKREVPVPEVEENAVHILEKPATEDEIGFDKKQVSAGEASQFLDSAREKSKGQAMTPVGQKKHNLVQIDSPARKEFEAPDGFVTLSGFLEILGISGNHWYRIKSRYDISSFRLGSRVVFKREEVEALKKQRDGDKKNYKPLRKSQIEAEFEKYEQQGEDRTGDLDLLGLHFREIVKIPIEVEKHKLWGAKIFVGQLVLHALTQIKNSEVLTANQQRQINSVLENPDSQYLLKQLYLAFSQRQQISEDKKDRSDYLFIKSVEGTGTFSQKVLAKAEIIEISELREEFLQNFIDNRLRQIRQGMEARISLTQANLRLVISRAKKFWWSGMELADLEGYGHFGLLRAVARWYFKEGYRFSTYATSWIDQTIGRAIADYARAIRLPVHINEKLAKLAKQREKFLGETGEDADFAQLVQDREGKDSLLAQAVRVRNLVSLSMEIGEDDDSYGRGSKLEDFLMDVNQDTEEEGLKEGLRAAMAEVLGTLPPRERKVLELRYGLLDGRAKTLDETAVALRQFDGYEVTRERIRQIEAKALKKLRHPSRARKLRAFHTEDPRSVKIRGLSGREMGIRRNRGVRRQSPLI